MAPTSLKYFFDIERACQRLQSFLGGKSRDAYLQDPLLQAAAARIPEYRRLIAFRNLLIHGYADVDHEIVWDLAQSRVAALRQVARAALDDGPSP